MRPAVLCTFLVATTASVVWADELPGDTDAIQTLTVEQAEELVRGAPGRQALNLNGLTTLSPETAEALAQHVGTLQLNGLTGIPLEAERALAKHRNRFGSVGLECRELTSLKSAELAEKLWGINSFYVFNKLQYVSPEAIGALTRQPWWSSSHSVSLDHVRELSPELAAALAACKGSLSLRGLTTLSAESARALMQTRHSPQEYTYALLALDGLTTIGPEVAAELARNPDSLSLSGVKEMSPDVARALARHRGYLRLDGVASVSDETAKALARHQGGMWLGVTRLSDEAAGALAEADHLRLPALVDVSAAALAALKARHVFLLLPPNGYSALEKFLWGITGWGKPLLLACLGAMMGCVGYLLWLAGKLAKAESLTTQLRQEYRLSTIPALIAAGLWFGLGVFLGCKIWPQYLKRWDDVGRFGPVATFVPLDWLMLLTGLTLIGLAGILPWAFQRLLRDTRPLWRMTPHFAVSPMRKADLIRIGALTCLASGAAVHLIVSYVYDAFLRSPEQYRHALAHEPLFLAHFHRLWLVFPMVLAAVAVLVHFLGIWSRPERCCEARPWGLGLFGWWSQVRSEPGGGRAGFIGDGIPWSSLVSYQWKPDHLELVLNLSRTKKGLLVRLFGVVPPEQRAAAEAFLSARVPGHRVDQQHSTLAADRSSHPEG